MADFYLLPPRPALGEELARLIRPYLPGLRITAADCTAFLASLADRSKGRSILIHREDLPEGIDPQEALQDGYGAEAGDRVIRIGLSHRPGEPNVRTAAISEPVLV